MIEAVALPVEDNAYAKQWATWFLLLSSPTDVDVSKVEQILRATMPDWEFDRFASYKTVVQLKDGVPTSGPWAGRLNMPNPYVAAIKVNARTANRVPATTSVTSSLGPTPMVGVALDTFRKVVKPQLKSLGYEDSYASFSPWGTQSSFTKDIDKGLPITPALPAPELPAPVVEDKSNAWVWWMLFGTAAATAYAYSRKTP